MRLQHTLMAAAVAVAAWSAPARAQDGSMVVIADIVGKPAQAQAVRDLMVPFAAQARKEPGCLRYELNEVAGEPGHFMTVETWADKAAFDTHMKTPAISAAVPVLTPMLAKPLVITPLALVKG